MIADTAIVGGTVVDGRDRFEATLLLSGRKVEAIVARGTPVDAKNVVDASGKLVLPGLIDAHVHLREPGNVHKEGFESGTRAAAAGGVTTVMVMPTDVPPTLTPQNFEQKLRLAEGKAHVDFCLQAGLGHDHSHVQALTELGAISFELFLADMPPELNCPDSATLLDALSAVAEYGGVTGITPGDDGIINRRMTRSDELNVAGPLAFALSRPPTSEALGVARACFAAEEVGARVHLRQISCSASLEVLALAKRRNRKPLSAEVMPHNLLLTEKELERQGPYAKVTPPLRPDVDVAKLWEGISAGLIDIIATDHAPHLPSEKEAGRENIWIAPGGFPGVQTLLPLLLGEVSKKRLTYEDVVRLCSEMPARLFGLYPRKGTLQPGSDADIVIVDPDHDSVILNEQQYSKARITPFNGWRVRGWPVLTLLGGEAIMRDGLVEGGAKGRFVQPFR